MPLTRYDMRWPSSPHYEDAMEVRVCRTFWGRVQGACWLLFTNWKRPLRLGGTDDPWAPWFAWYPVRAWGVRGPTLSTEWTWMRWVERRLRPDWPQPWEDMPREEYGLARDAT